MRRLIQQKLWSPEQIDCRLKLEENPLRISYATIYRAIDKGILTGNCYSEASRFISGKRGTEKRGKIIISHDLSERLAPETGKLTRIG